MRAASCCGTALYSAELMVRWMQLNKENKKLKNVTNWSCGSVSSRNNDPEHAVIAKVEYIQEQNDLVKVQIFG